MYGDDESTLSTSTWTWQLSVVGLPDGAPDPGSLMMYLNLVGDTTSLTKYDPLNLVASVPVTPLIRIGVPTDRLWLVVVVTWAVVVNTFTLT